MTDPAFLFYPKDFEMSTQHMDLMEKGAYLTLLNYQHQNGSVPSDIKRLSLIWRVSRSDAEELWSVLGEKFPEGEDGKRCNERLCQEITRRKDYSKKKKVLGVFGDICRREVPEDQVKKVKKAFDWKEFSELTDSDTIRLAIKKWIVDYIGDYIDNRGGVVEQSGTGTGTGTELLRSNVDSFEIKRQRLLDAPSPRELLRTSEFADKIKTLVSLHIKPGQAENFLAQAENGILARKAYERYYDKAAMIAKWMIEYIQDPNKYEEYKVSPSELAERKRARA